ncbi:MAG: hypothetical protein NVSMB48_22770 [Marmoricola sp.]
MFFHVVTLGRPKLSDTSMPRVNVVAVVAAIVAVLAIVMVLVDGPDPVDGAVPDPARCQFIDALPGRTP